MALSKCFAGIIRRLEDPRIPFVNFLITFLGAVTLRDYLEQFSDKTPASPVLEVHYSLLYTCLGISLIILFHFVTRERIELVARAVLSGFMILPFVPVIDLLLSFGRGYTLSYLFPGVHHHLWQGFFLFAGPFEGQGVSPGQRMEFVLVVLMSGAYIYVKTNKLLWAFLTAFFVYALIFCYAAVPFFIKMADDVCGIPVLFTQEGMVRFYLLLSLPLSQALFYLYNRGYFIAIWKDARILRIIHFLLMVILGSVFTLNHDIRISPFRISWIFIPVAIMFSGLFSIMVNNWEDHEIDRVSNPGRPTVSGTVPMGHYRVLAWAFLVFGLSCAAAAGFSCFFTVLIWTCVYYIYSSMPFRLKRVPVLSKSLIAFNSMAFFSLGYSLSLARLTVPPVIAVYFLVCFTAVINFIDIKDYEGDKNAGILTLPTILGLEKSKFLVGIFFLIAYPSAYFLVQDFRLLPAMVIWGIWMFILVNRRDYDENVVFKSYLLSIILLIGYFLWVKSTGQYLNAV